MQRRVAKIAQEYGGRELSVGDPFDVDTEHISLLLSMGRIEREAHDVPNEYETRDMQAAPAPAYQTRDMAGTLHVKRPYHRKTA